MSPCLLVSLPLPFLLSFRLTPRHFGGDSVPFVAQCLARREIWADSRVRKASLDASIGLFDCRSPDVSSPSFPLIPNFLEEFSVFHSLKVDVSSTCFSDSRRCCFKVVRKIGFTYFAHQTCCAPIFDLIVSVAEVSRSYLTSFP